LIAEAAALCGVVDLMPRYGGVSGAGVVPLSPTYDHARPLAGTVEDAALLLQAIAGCDPADPNTLPLPAEDFAIQLGRDLHGVRLGVPPNYFYDGWRRAIASSLMSRSVRPTSARWWRTYSADSTGCGEAKPRAPVNQRS
jgi:Asp-tRNA(Asn)/Glu-tRNA(Gln) amidotransferase A subunit family amidase